jgi:hypothetical protein
MRTTVGPLPSAVYWRRRAVVLGAVLLGIIVLFVSCSGDGKDDKTGRNAGGSQLPTPAPASPSDSPDPQTSFLDGVPGGNAPSLPAPGDLESQGANGGGNTGTGNGTGQNTNVTGPSDGSCADNEMSVVPGAAATTIKRGSPVDLTVTIKNVGSRTCSRDVGAGPQELYLEKGAQKYWSSDTCSTDRSKDVRQFAPGEQRSYRITWNGRQSNACTANAASGPNPPPGQFELRARLGTLISGPLLLTIVA